MECDMKKLFALLCALLLLAVSCGALAEDAPIFNFRNGVRWEMTPEQVTACEGAEPDVSREEGTQTGVQYLKVGVSKYSAQLIYMFRDNQLKLAMYGIADTTEDDYAYLDNALVSLYGAHADMDGTVVIEAVSAIPLNREEARAYLNDGAWIAEECIDSNYSWGIAVHVHDDISNHLFTTPDVTIITDEVPPIRFLAR